MQFIQCLCVKRNAHFIVLKSILYVQAIWSMINHGCSKHQPLHMYVSPVGSAIYISLHSLSIFSFLFIRKNFYLSDKTAGIFYLKFFEMSSST